MLNTGTQSWYLRSLEISLKLCKNEKRKKNLRFLYFYLILITYAWSTFEGLHLVSLALPYKNNAGKNFLILYFPPERETIIFYEVKDAQKFLA